MITLLRSSAYGFTGTEWVGPEVEHYFPSWFCLVVHRNRMGGTGSLRFLHLVVLFRGPQEQNGRSRMLEITSLPGDVLRRAACCPESVEIDPRYF